MIGVMSDSHDNVDAVRRAVRFFRRARCRGVLHAGDFVAPFAARELGGLGCPVKAVYGNCDGERAGLKAALQPFGDIHDPPCVFTLFDLRILLTHVPVSEKASDRERLDVCISGHTHRPDVRRVGGLLFLNPGETGGWVSGRSSVALLDPLTGEAEIVYL